MLAETVPTAVIDWMVSAVGGGEVTRLQRHVVAKREAYNVDVMRSDSSTLRGFLRLERHPQLDDPWPFTREVAIVDALSKTSVPVPKVYASGGPLDAALFERVPGVSDLQNMPLEQQRPVMEHFIDIMADWHTLDVESLGLPPMFRPSTSHECALTEMENVLRKWSDFLKNYRDPLLTYGVDWLKRFAPPRFERISLLHGDCGPVNFLFEGNRVTSVIDWEWAHLGDPMEDLGNFCVREFWNPCGGMTGLLARYEKRSGIPTDPKNVLYYRVQTQMRGTVSPRWMTETRAHPREPLAWWLCYRYIGDRATCEAIADYMGIELRVPEFPGKNNLDDAAATAIADAAVWALREDIEPALGSPFAKSKVNEADILVRCLEKLHCYGSAIDQIEREELGELLGRRPASTKEGLEQLDDAIRKKRFDDERVLRYLANRAFRAEWLYAPAARIYPNRRWSPL